MDLFEIGAPLQMARQRALLRRKRKFRVKSGTRRVIARRAARQRSSASRRKAARKAVKTRMRRWGGRTSILGA